MPWSVNETKNPEILILMNSNLVIPKYKKDFAPKIEMRGRNYTLVSIAYCLPDHFTCSFVKNGEWYYYDDFPQAKVFKQNSPRMENAHCLFYVSDSDDCKYNPPFYFKARGSSIATNYGMIFSDGQQWILDTKDGRKIKHKDKKILKMGWKNPEDKSGKTCSQVVDQEKHCKPESRN